MTNKDLKLPKNPTLKDFQEYELKMEKIRGFYGQNILEKCILLGEEVGELFESVRKSRKIKIDEKTKVDPTFYEVADVFILILAICNTLGIDLEEAFREKEKYNKKRKWK